MIKPTQRYALELDAHSLDDEFEQTILKQYDVRILDRTDEPWSVIFEGTQEQLMAMVLAFWGDHMKIGEDDFVPLAT